jgi:zinc transporter, ZIP family
MEMGTEKFLTALTLSTLAGLSTGIGSAIALFAKKTSKRFLSTSLGFSAGVMIYVSLVEMFNVAKADLTVQFGPAKGYWMTAIAFFAGVFIIAIIDKLIPSMDNPHEMQSVEAIDYPGAMTEYRGLYRTGLFTAAAITLHNFPEGLATFASAMKDLRIGVPIAIAIAIHNIPEGIAVSVPIYYATGSHKKAFWLSFLSGLVEPISGVIGYVILMHVLNSVISSVILAASAGIMVFISVDELLPAAEKYGKHHYAVYGFIAGMITMALSLIMFT